MRYQEIKLVEDIQLDEINMSPGSLQRLAGAIDARAGMEFEMIVPDVGSVDDDYGDMEPDYDSDESVVSIDDACNFFYDGDYNGRRDIANLRDSMQQDFEEWVIENFDEYWADNALELIREYLTLNASDRDIIEILELGGGEAEEVEENGASKEDYAAAAERVIDDQNSSAWYDDARDAAQSDYLNDGDRQEEWLASAGISTMADVERNYDITWPHYYNPNEGNGEYNIEQVASEFEDAIGRSVYHSTSYHGAHRSPTAYSLEPDGSLDPENAEDAGLEFISPPLPVSEMLEDLKKVKAWAAKRGCYTNKSTGLHINISVPNYSLRNLDYVKLALLLGDEYVLSQFGRMSNTYAKSAISKVRDKIKQHSESAKELMDKMREHMEDLATKAVHSGTTDKYTSINTKDGYIEFRSPGGDWLGENFDKVENTLLRFVVAMDAAIDPEKYRTEYLKKLYKLLEPTAVEIKNPDTVKYFADYVAGKTPRAALRSFVKQAQLQRKVAKDPTGGQQYWWNVEWSNGRRMEVVATSADVAKQVAAEEWDLRPDDPQVRTFKATPIRPYDSSPVKASVGAPQAIGRRNSLSQTDIENRLGWPDQTGDANYEVVDRSNMQPVFKFVANTDQDAQRKYSQFLDVMMLPHDTENYGYREIALPGSTVDLQRQRAAHNRVAVDDLFGELNDEGPGQQYKIIRMSDRSLLTVVRASSQQEAETKAAEIFRANGLDPDLYDVFPAQPQQQQQPAPQPAGAGREFAGWKVLLPSGEEVYRFSGVGNSQADANRIAADWLRRNGMGVSGEGYEVVPVWREA